MFRDTLKLINARLLHNFGEGPSHPDVSTGACANQDFNDFPHPLGKIKPLTIKLSLWEWRYIAPCINLGTRCRWLVSFKPWPLYTAGKPPPRHPLDRWLGGCWADLKAMPKKRQRQNPIVNRTPVVQPVALKFRFYFLIQNSPPSRLSWTHSCHDVRCFLHTQWTAPVTPIRRYARSVVTRVPCHTPLIQYM